MSPTPDPTLALALADAGYWIVPLHGHRKHPDRIGSKTHGELVRAGDRDYLTAHVHAQRASATGWALIPQPGDPDPLVVLDLDLYGLTLPDAWAKIADGDPLPSSAAVVQSASGGFHFYFRLPAQAVADKLPHTWDFGNGRAGEVRASRAALQLIVLPGSVCLGKTGELGAYVPAQGNIMPTGDLALLPDSLQVRLVSRKPGAADPERGPLPTEATHLLDLLHFISEIPAGAQNGAASKIGQIMGRIGPADQASTELVSTAWDVFRERAHATGDPWTFTAFEKALRSGYKTGRRNAQKFQPRDKVPTVDDAKAEVISIFGGWPALAELVDYQGKVREWVLSFDGRQIHLPSLDSVDIVATLARLFPGVDHNAVSTSPVFTMPGWSRAILYALKTERTVERLGDDAETIFWELTEAAAVDAADAGKIMDVWTGSRAALGNPAAFIVWPAAEEPWLVLTPKYEERFLARVGTVTEVRRLIKQHLSPKGLRCQGKSGKMLVIALARLSEEAQAKCRKGYERWVAARQERMRDE